MADISAGSTARKNTNRTEGAWALVVSCDMAPPELLGRLPFFAVRRRAEIVYPHFHFRNGESHRSKAFLDFARRVTDVENAAMKFAANSAPAVGVLTRRWHRLVLHP